MHTRCGIEHFQTTCTGFSDAGTRQRWFYTTCSVFLPCKSGLDPLGSDGIKVIQLLYIQVFYTAGLMRMRLTPAADKMVISHMKGYLLVIHDLNLQTLRQDLEGNISHIGISACSSCSQSSNSPSGFRR